MKRTRLGATIVKNGALHAPYKKRPVRPKTPITFLTGPASPARLDLRAREACAAKRIPGSECTPLDKLGEIGLEYAPGVRDLVLVGGADLAEIPEAAAAYQGRVLALRGGFGAWQEFALDEPVPPQVDASAEELDRYRFRAALNRALTGSVAPPPPPAAATAYVPKKKKKGGGCE